MERVQSLINKLAEQSQSRVPTAELLQTTELLYAELRGYIPDNTVSVPDSVAVWLPAGYGVPKTSASTKHVEQVNATQPVEIPKPMEEKTAEERPVETKPFEETQPAMAAEKPA